MICLHLVLIVQNGSTNHTYDSVFALMYRFGSSLYTNRSTACSYRGIDRDTDVKVISQWDREYFDADSLTPNTLYEFTVSASNSKGNSEPVIARITTVSQQLQSSPPTPTQFRSTAKTSLTVSLAWSPGVGGNSDLPVRNYTIWIKKIGAGSYDRIDLYIPSTDTSAVVDQLLPKTEYSFKLLAMNDFGMLSQQLEMSCYYY